MKANLTVTTWVDSSVIGATHYYGRIQIEGRRTDITVERTIGKAEAKQLNKDERDAGDGPSYKVGDISGRFWSEAQVIEAAVAYMQEKHPTIAYLMNGCRSCLDPQPCLIGPEPIKTALNALVAEAEANDWWEGDEDVMKDIFQRWEKTAPWRIKESSEV